MSIRVLLVKLTSGEEIIARVANESDTKYTLSKVRLLMTSQQPDGQVGMGMIPWMMGAPENDVTVDKSIISGNVVGEIPKNLEDAYLQQTSGIQLG